MKPHVIQVVSMMVVGAALGGCGGKEATPEVLSVTFSIKNDGSSNHCGGGVGAHDVANITLKQSVTGEETVQQATVPAGYSRDVQVVIPKNDTYDVFIYSVDYCCNPGSGCEFDPAIFMKTPLESGHVYTVHLAGGSDSTLDSVPSTGIF